MKIYFWDPEEQTKSLCVDSLVEALGPDLEIEHLTGDWSPEALPQDLCVIIKTPPGPLKPSEGILLGFLAGISLWCGIWGESIPPLPVESFADLSLMIPSLLVHKNLWQREAELKALQRTVENKGREFCRTDFIQAVEEGDDEIVTLYLRAGFSPSLANKKGVSLISLAIRKKHSALVDTLLDKGADINAVSRDRQNTPLMDAAAEGLPDLTRKLIQRGAALDSLSRSGQTALMLALGKGDEESSLLLLEAGADFQVVDLLGMSAQNYASLFGRKKVLEYLKTR